VERGKGGNRQWQQVRFSGLVVLQVGQALVVQHIQPCLHHHYFVTANVRDLQGKWGGGGDRQWQQLRFSVLVVLQVGQALYSTVPQRKGKVGAGLSWELTLRFRLHPSLAK